MATPPRPSVAFDTATLGGGCFWCLEAVFLQLQGVEHVVSGYAGGHDAHPTYDAVCSGETGHAEVVQVTFDPSVITFRNLLDVFFTIHDPTTLNRQGPDVGTQYRSVIFYHDEEQRQVAERAMQELAQSGTWPQPIVTELQPLPEFYAAEPYHQDYYARNGRQPYCQAVVAPKVAKARNEFMSLLKKG